MNLPRRHAGFSLIEVMVAILILGIALTGLVHGLTTALASNKQSELQTIAVLFAQGKIEELRAEQILKNGEEDGDCGAVLPLYHWRQTISPADLPGLHDVTVVVEQAQTKQEIYELKTLLFVADDEAIVGQPGDRKDSKSKSPRNRRS
jgi:prepilin-type N-terminal cleavage/methylation domain-containing protein